MAVLSDGLGVQSHHSRRKPKVSAFPFARPPALVYRDETNSNVSYVPVTAIEEDIP